jgi:hypothetical protein
MNCNALKNVRPFRVELRTRASVPYDFADRIFLNSCGKQVFGPCSYQIARCRHLWSFGRTNTTLLYTFKCVSVLFRSLPEIIRTWHFFSERSRALPKKFGNPPYAVSKLSGHCSDGPIFPEFSGTLSSSFPDADGFFRRKHGIFHTAAFNVLRKLCGSCLFESARCPDIFRKDSLLNLGPEVRIFPEGERVSNVTLGGL